jgi:CheY-like chemotaxis protein
MKVLVVEDNEKNLKLFRNILKANGYEPIEAKNGEEAVKAAKAELPALILMDVQLPVLDGITAMRSIKSDPATKDIPIIALTAYAMQGDKERLLEEGFDNYISKPIDLKEFLRVVKEMSGVK